MKIPMLLSFSQSSLYHTPLKKSLMNSRLNCNSCQEGRKVEKEGETARRKFINKWGLEKGDFVYADPEQKAGGGLV